MKRAIVIFDVTLTLSIVSTNKFHALQFLQSNLQQSTFIQMNFQL